MKILVMDDEAAVRSVYREIFESDPAAYSKSRSALLAAELFGQTESGSVKGQDDLRFEVQYASQGLEGVELIRAAAAADEPFKVAFIDVRMPPGIDGRETARRIREIDRDINLVIVTAYSDHLVTDIVAVAGPPDKLFYICKPFATDEVRQTARALAQRWDHDTRQIEFLRKKLAELAASEARALHLASHDYLTGAPNRMAFEQKLAASLGAKTARMAIAVLDLDRFKQVNDTFGHGAGDELLVKVYAALTSLAPPRAVVARLGGDEFGILFPSSSIDAARTVCEALVAACTRSFSVMGQSVHIGASCGFVDSWRFPEREPIELLRLADLALFAAKQDRSRHVVLYDEAFDASLQFRQQVEAGLYAALDAGELELHYQPIVERAGLEIAGYEALLRWTSGVFGEVPPSVFIPIAESSQLIIALGNWVTARALADASRWRDQFVSINVSPRQFRHPDFVSRLVEQVRENGIDPCRVQIEITETALFDDHRSAREILQQLRQAGLRIALDDFGTGYSNMANLKDFPVDCIKIDRSFVDAMGSDKQSAAIITAIVQLARGLNLEIVAEGVETDLQCQALRLIGCSHMQGFLFGKAGLVETLAADAFRGAGRVAAGGPSG